MKRLFGLSLALLLVAALVPVFAGGQGEEEGGDEGTADETITLTMFEYQNVTDEAEVAVWDTLLERFKELHPNVEFEIDALFDEAYHNKLQAMAVAEELPDIMFLWPGKRTGAVTGSGQIKDLRPWLEAHMDEFSPTAVAAQGPNGEIWELPEQVTATHVMYTNERLLDELDLEFPKTMEDLIAQGEAIRDAGYIPIAMDNAAGWQMQSCLLSALVERTGGRDWLEDAVNGDASFSDPEFVDALAIIDTLATEEMLTPGINQAEYGQALTDFINEEAVYFIDGGWRVNNLVNSLEDDQKEYMTLNVFPEVPNTRGQAASTAAVAGTGYGMNADLEGEKAEMAWEWIWFYSGPEGSEIRQAEGALPAYKLPVPEDADVMVKRLTEFVNNTPSGYVIDAVLGQEGMAVLQNGMQEMILGNLTPEELGERYESWVAENEETRL
ncbi:MAG: ABC transporter substrate-binding protein [Spirochaetota bacterium]